VYGTRTSVHLRRSVRMVMATAPPGWKRLNADIPEDLYKDFAKRCIELGINKKDFIKFLLEKELYGDLKKN